MLLPELMPVAVKAEYEDTFVAEVQPALSAPLAPLAMTLATLRPPCRALQVPGLLRLHGNGAASWTGAAALYFERHFMVLLLLVG